MSQLKVKDIQVNDAGQKEAMMTVTNNAIKFLKETVNIYIQHEFGDVDDPKQNALKQEIKDDLHEAWKTLNPS